MRSDMGDELDVDAMLEAPFTKEDQRSSADVEEERKENGHGETSKEERPKDNGEKSSPAKEDRGSGRDRERSGRDRDRDKRRDRHSRSRSRDRRQNRSRSRDRRGDRRRSRSRGRGDRDRERRDLGDRRERRRRSRSGSRERRRRSPSGSREKRRRTRSKSRERRRRTRSRSRDRRRRSRSHSKEKNKSKSKTPKRELTAEERDARTVFCMQLSSRIKARDLEDFFSVVGKISDVRIITDAKTRRSKGIAYVEFEDVESVPLALGLSGQKVLGVPIIVQLTMAEKNRAANVEAMTIRGNMGPMRLYVGSLHFNITEDMLRSIFEPFGRIESIQLINDTETGRSKGYGFVTFQNAEDAKKALEQLNGFELAGRAMKVNHVTERADGLPGIIENDDMERSGFDSAAAANPNKINQSFVFLSGATGRLQLMAKLAEGTGMELPQAATNHLNMPTPQVPQQQLAPPIATQCFLLSNMFDPSAENNPNWAKDISDDVIEECNKHGGVFHVFVDRQSAQGNVYVKCPSIATAVAAVNALHGRYFAGKMITAAYVPVLSYHSLFPDAMTTTKLL